VSVGRSGVGVGGYNINVFRRGDEGSLHLDGWSIIVGLLRWMDRWMDIIIDGWKDS
jgi:hypothetical protein